MSEPWDWNAIAASDYPVVVEPSLLRRDVVYCEFWSAPGENGAYAFVGGLQMSWANFVALRETPAGELLQIEVFQLAEPYLMLDMYRARFSLWTAPENPRWPRTTVAVWSVASGFNKPGVSRSE